MQKVTIDAGFTCPNRDGKISVGGCTYCNNDAFNPSYCSPEKPVKQQILEGIEFHKNRYRRANKFLAYFQPYSNTYAPLDKLRKIYGQALNIENVVGLVIGTRPDCIDEKKLDYFRELSENFYVIIEYGIESCYDETLKRINRGHDFDSARRTIIRTAEKGIKTGAHIIFGLPGETTTKILKEAEILSELPLNNLKIHQLQIIKNTKMADEYKKNPEYFTFFELDDYINLVIDFIELLNPAIVIERFAGEAPTRFIAGPNWGLIRNDRILQKTEKRFLERDTWQGKFFLKKNVL